MFVKFTYFTIVFVLFKPRKNFDMPLFGPSRNKQSKEASLWYIFVLDTDLSLCISQALTPIKSLMDPKVSINIIASLHERRVHLEYASKLKENIVYKPKNASMVFKSINCGLL